MLRLFLRLMLVVGIGMTGAACLDDGNAAPRIAGTDGLLSAGTDGLQQPVLQQRLLQSRTCFITVWLYHGDRDEPRPERKS